jgi:hypothetical protein
MSAPVDDFDLDVRLGTIETDYHGSTAALVPPTEQQSICHTFCRSRCNTICPGC